MATHRTWARGARLESQVITGLARPGRRVGSGFCCPLGSPCSPVAVLRLIRPRPPSLPRLVPGAGTRGAGCGRLGLPRSVATTDAPAFFTAAGFPRAGTPGRPGWLGGGRGTLQGVSRPSPRSPRMHFCLTVRQASQRDRPPSRWAAGVLRTGASRGHATENSLVDSQELGGGVTSLTGAHRQGGTPVGGNATLPRACGHAEWGAEFTLLLPLNGREGAQRLGAWPQAQIAWL